MVAKACEKACIAIITLVDTCTRWDHNVGTTDLTHIYINCTTNFHWKEWLRQLEKLINYEQVSMYSYNFFKRNPERGTKSMRSEFAFWNL